jgi:hypothetical protein
MAHHYSSLRPAQQFFFSLEHAGKLSATPHARQPAGMAAMQSFLLAVRLRTMHHRRQKPEATPHGCL